MGGKNTTKIGSTTRKTRTTRCVKTRSKRISGIRIQHAAASDLLPRATACTFEENNAGGIGGTSSLPQGGDLYESDVTKMSPASASSRADGVMIVFFPMTIFELLCIAAR